MGERGEREEKKSRIYKQFFIFYLINLYFAHPLLHKVKYLSTSPAIDENTIHI